VEFHCMHLMGTDQIRIIEIFVTRNIYQTGSQWLTHVILATWEGEDHGLRPA
jgi:hypothetical protein